MPNKVHKLKGVYYLCVKTIEKSVITQSYYKKGLEYHETEYRTLTSKERLNFIKNE